MKIKAKLSAQKQELFRTLVEELITDGYDVSLMENQTEVSIYLPESMVSIVLTQDGRWRRE